MGTDNPKEGDKRAGEFTEIFGTSRPPASDVKPNSKSRAPAGYQPQRPDRGAPPEGEFTQVFNTAPGAMPPSSGKPGAQKGAGEFTQIFGDAQKPPEVKKAVDERSFSSYSAQRPTPPVSEVVPPSGKPAADADFTHFFNNRLPASEGLGNGAKIESQPEPAAREKAPGDFTRAFGPSGKGLPPREASAEVRQPEKPATQESNYTNYFERPAKPVEPRPMASIPEPAAKSVEEEPKRVAPSVQKPSSPPVVALVIILAVILIAALCAMYYFVLRN